MKNNHFRKLLAKALVITVVASSIGITQLTPALAAGTDTIQEEASTDNGAEQGTEAEEDNNAQDPDTPDEVTTGKVVMHLESENTDVKAFVDDQELTGTANEDGSVSYDVENGKTLKIQVSTQDGNTIQVTRTNHETGEEEALTPDENGFYCLDVNQDEDLTIKADSENTDDEEGNVTVTPVDEDENEETLMSNSNENSLGGRSGRELFQLLAVKRTAPAGYDQNDQTHPYGYGSDLIVKQRQSALYTGTSYVTNDGKDEGNTVSLTKGTEQRNASASSEMMNLSYTQAVSCDAYGSGQRNVIVEVGVDQTSSANVWAYAWDGSTNQMIGKVKLGTASWMVSCEHAYGIALTDENARNFMAITSGDYDKDGKDSVIVYADMDGDSYNLMELSIGDHSMTVTNKSKELLNDAYKAQPALRNVVDNKAFKGATDSRLACDLATGDLNGDGVDDIAVVSNMMGKYWYDWAEAKDQSGYSVDGPIIPQVKVAYGARQSGQDILARSADSAISLKTGNTSLRVCGIDVGRVYNDNVNRIVVAGMMMDSTQKDMCDSYYQNHYFYRGAYVVSMNNGTLSAGNLKQITGECNFPGYGKDKTYVRCVASSGSMMQEDVFVHNNIYRYEGDSDPTPKKLAESKEYYRWIVGIDTVCDNVNGFEKLVVNFDSAISEGKFGRTYWQVLAEETFSGNARLDSKTGEITAATGYSVDHSLLRKMTQSERPGYRNNRANGIAVGCETKADDVLLMRLCDKGYYNTDIKPVAILQAAPYFKNINDAGSSTYALKTSYSTGEDASQNSSLGLGISESVGLGVFKESFSITAKKTMSESFKTSLSTSSTVSFTAADKDTVIMQKVPVLYYSYEVYDASCGQWKSNAVGLTFAKDPVYYQLTVDEYNDFVNYYDEFIDNYSYKFERCGVDIQSSKLNTISKETYFLGNEGNPSGYTSSILNLPNGTKICKSSQALSYGGGSGSYNYSTETSQTQTKSTSWSTDWKVDVQFGGTLKLLSGWVGASINKSNGSSSGTFTTTGIGNSISGTVKNIETAKVTKNGALPDTVARDYGFIWNMGMAEFPVYKLSGAGTEENTYIPVLAYEVREVTSGASAPVQNKLTVDGRNVNLSWNAPELKDGETITCYTVYKEDINGEIVKIANLKGGDIRNYTYTVPAQEGLCGFMITATVSRSDGSVSQSIMSNEQKVIVSVI